MVVYMCERVSDVLDSKDFLGLFSNFENAVLACNNNHKKHFAIEELPELKFVRNKYGFWTADSRHNMYEYEIFECELDKWIGG